MFASLLTKTPLFPKINPFIKKILLMNPITNSDTLITNTANFLFYENLINQEVLTQIMHLSEAPSKSKKINLSKCQNSPKIVKHVKGGRKVDLGLDCETTTSTIESETSKFWDGNMYKMIDILSLADVTLYQMNWLDKSIIYESGLFWPKRSLKISFINKVCAFLTESKFTFLKANFDDKKTEMIPSNFYLSEIINENLIPKVHILGTKDFYLGNPFNFYNFVNYEILNLKFGENK